MCCPDIHSERVPGISEGPGLSACSVLSDFPRPGLYSGLCPGRGTQTGWGMDRSSDHVWRGERPREVGPLSLEEGLGGGDLIILSVGLSWDRGSRARAEDPKGA